MLMCDKCDAPLENNRCPECGKWFAPDSDRIAFIRVDRLFSKFSFEITFASPETVSILIAPNGFGKTTMFHFINFMLFPSYESYIPILGIPFRRIVCVMKDGGEIGLAQGRCNQEDTSVEVQRILSSQSVHLLYWYKDKEGIVHRWWLDKALKDNLSLYTRLLKPSTDKSATEDKTKHILDCLFADLRRKIPTISMKFFPADRLFVSEEKKNSVYSDLNLENINETVSQMIRAAKNEYEKRYIRTINKYFNDLAVTNHLYENSQNHYGRLTEKEIVSIKERLTEKWKIYADKVQLYTEQDLLAEYFEANSYKERGALKPNSNLFSCDKYDHTNECLLIVDELCSCLLEAMKPIDELYRRFKLFLEIINERLSVSDKRIALNQGKLIVQQNGIKNKLPLSVLSSGEKNDLYLFYELAFSTEEVGLVLIDEPEISWHIEWQMSFVDRLKEICEMNSFQAIIATHSPSIINGHMELIAERVNKNYV